MVSTLEPINMISRFQILLSNGGKLVCRYSTVDTDAADLWNSSQMECRPFKVGAVQALNPVDPALESARFQPLSLPLDPS
jgi:hypothetical protein